MTRPTPVTRGDPSPTISVARCECCDLPEFACGKARQDQQRADDRAQRARLLDDPAWLAARFPGCCGGCREPIAVGDPIMRPYGQGPWLGACCGDQPGALAGAQR